MFGTIAYAVLGAVVAWATYFLLVVPCRFRRHFSKQGVPSPPFRLLVGDLPELLDSIRSDDVFHESRVALARYGKMYTSCFGPLPRLVIVSAELAESVFIKNAKCYHKTSQGKMILEPLLGKGLFFSEGALWKRQRQLINSAFHPQYIKQMIEFMLDSTDACIAKWTDALSASREGGAAAIEIDVHRDMSAVTLDVIASGAFGSAFRDEPEIAEAVYEAFTSTLEDIQKRNLSVIGLIPYLNKLPTPGYLRIRAATQRIRDIVLRIVEQRRRGESHALCEGKDLLDLILGARDDATGTGMSEEQLKDEAMTFVIAGHETTANLMTWTLSVLTRDEKLWARCVAEVDAALGGARPTYETIKKLPVMDAVLAETLRVYPPVPFLRREAVRDHELAGKIRVKAGTMVSLNVFLLHRDPEHWPDPERFDIDRWLGGGGGGSDAAVATDGSGGGGRRHRACYMPFGGGPRSCIGKNFALLECKVILASMMQRFAAVHLVPGQKIVPELNLTMRPKYGVKVRLVPKQ